MKAFGYVAVFCLAAACGARADDIVIGMSAAFDGPASGLGLKLWRGSSAYFQHVNASGGIHGRKIRVEPLNDGYDPTPAVNNTVALIEERNVFLLFGYVGTPTVTRVLPLLKLYEPRRMYLFFPYTGARPPRSRPYGDFVFNLRASYEQETEGLVANLVAIGRTRIGVFYQNDAYGRSGWEGTRRALEKRKLSIAADAGYRRGASQQADFREQARILNSSQVDAVIAIGTYAACAGFLRDARDLGLNVPILSPSFVGSEDLLRLLLEIGKSKGRDYTGRIVISQVVPSYDDLALPAVREYRSLTDREDLTLPLPGGRQEHGYSFAAFEGFLGAKLLVEVLNRLGPALDKSRLRAAAESIRDFDLGIGVPASFGPDRHQALDAIYYTTVENSRLVPVRSFAKWRR